MYINIVHVYLRAFKVILVDVFTIFYKYSAKQFDENIVFHSDLISIIYLYISRELHAII